MSLADVVDDLLTLEELAEHEHDPDRRRSLDAVRSHLADRDRGAKVSEVAHVLGLSQPTVRAWSPASSNRSPEQRLRALTSFRSPMSSERSI